MTRTVGGALGARFLFGQHTRFLEGPDRTEACTVGKRTFASPGEATAYGRGLADFPACIETGAAYLLGFFDAEQHADGERGNDAALRLPMERWL